MDAGDVLVDRYRLVGRIGAGGMSVVWRAHDEVLHRDVAVKVLATGRGHRLASADAIRLEARAAAQLAHAHIANVFDYGEIDDGTGNRVPFVVMELLRGTTLAELLAEGPLEPDVALVACGEVAEALAEAHAHGLVHRDVKPSNIMMTAGGAKVFDFGIAVPVGTVDDPGLNGPILGTPAYVAPERITSGQASPASDVYALGVLLYRLLTHDYPWPAGTASHMLYAHVYGEARDLPPIDGVPDSVRDLYRRCVAKEPTDRPSAAEAAAVLAAARPRADSPGPAAPPAGAAATAIEHPRPPRWKSRWWRAAAAAAMVGAVAIALAGLTGESDPLVDDPAHAGPPAASPAVTSSATPTTAGAGGPSSGAAAKPAASGAPTAGPTTGPSPTAPPSGTPTATTTSASRTFTSDGGTVVAECVADRARLLWSEPAEGFRLITATSGPAAQAIVIFRRRGTEVRMTVTCPDATPTVAVSIVSTPA